MEFPLPKCLLTRTTVSEPLLKKGKVFGANGLKAEVHLLPDTGAQVNLISDKLVGLLFLETRRLRNPIRLGSVKETNAMTLTHFSYVKHRIGSTIFTEKFLVAPLVGQPEVICGTPWMEKHCPHVLRALRKLGDWDWEKKEHCVQTAFSRGGVIAAIKEEEKQREKLLNKAKDAQCATMAAYVLLAQVKEELQKREGSPEQEVRGLTGNKPGWEMTIPDKFRKYCKDVFADPPLGELPPQRPGFDCEITLKEGAQLKACKLYPMSKEELETLRQLLDHELALGFLRPSSAAHSAPVFFVRDPPSEGRNQGQLRLVVDYRDLNSKIKMDDYPIPLSRTILGWIAGFPFARKFDMRGGFRGIPMSGNSADLASFKTQFGQFAPTVMPMGLATAPAIYQRFINHILQDLIGVCCYAYLDDVIVVGNTLEELDAATEQVLQRLQKHKIRVKPSKCVWNADEITFLGYTWVKGKGLRMAHDKIKFIREIKPPRSLRDLRSMLGMVNFYRIFIPHYADLTAGLTNLTKKGEAWRWEAAEEQAWQALLKSVRNDVFLQGFDPDKPIELGTDASDEALGGYIAQPDANGRLRPVYFFHHKFKDAEKEWDAGDKELFAIVYAYREFRDILRGPKYPVEIYSDHRNLAKFMFTTNLLKSHDGRLGRWWEELSGCPFTIMYKPGEENTVADFLSRYGQNDSAALEQHVLLPLHRFHPKAQEDLLRWFKSSPRELNIREKLETSFASRAKRSSPRQKTEELAFAQKLNDSSDPVPTPTDASVTMAGVTRLLFGDRFRAVHPRAQLPEVPTEHIRGKGQNWGLGFPLASRDIKVVTGACPPPPVFIPQTDRV